MELHGSTIYLVSCVSLKREEPTAARDLYISTLFQKARRHVEASRCPWFILSAEHGLVVPDQVIAPYDKTLNTMKMTDRRAWSERVLIQLGKAVPDLVKVVFLAGKRYREFLVPHLKEHGVEISIPMEGLGIGEQLRWLTQNTPDPP